jgi:hypothetical protein
MPDVGNGVIGFDHVRFLLSPLAVHTSMRKPEMRSRYRHRFQVL